MAGVPVRDDPACPRTGQSDSRGRVTGDRARDPPLPDGDGPPVGNAAGAHGRRRRLPRASVHLPGAPPPDASAGRSHLGARPTGGRPGLRRGPRGAREDPVPLCGPRGRTCRRGAGGQRTGRRRRRRPRRDRRRPRCALPADALPGVQGPGDAATARRVPPPVHRLPRLGRGARAGRAAPPGPGAGRRAGGRGVRAGLQCVEPPDLVATLGGDPADDLPGRGLPEPGCGGPRALPGDDGRPPGRRPAGRGDPGLVGDRGQCALGATPLRGLALPVPPGRVFPRSSL